MYAVIFIAEINELDKAYSEMTLQMQELAMEKYGCSKFVSVTEGSHEIAISYWQDQEQIKKWKLDAEHLVAQKLGRSRWYISYKI